MSMKRRNKAASAAPAPAHAVATPTGSRRRLWLTLALCLVGSAAISFVVFRYFVAAIPPQLLGTWQVTEGSLRGATLEFRPNGTAIAIRHLQGKKEITRSSVRVSGKTIFLTDRDDRTGKEETVKQTIIQLDADE